MRLIPARAAITARDLDATLDFYTKSLGLPLVLRGDDFALIGRAGGMCLELRAARSATGSSDETRPVKVGFLVESRLESAMARLRERGIDDFGEVDDRGLVRLAFFDDPDGNALYLLEAPAMGAGRDGGGPAGQERLSLLDHLEVRWLKLAPGEVVIEMDLRDDLLGPAGALQGGVTTTLIDVAAATAMTLSTETAAVATTHMAVDFVAPGRGGPIRAVARPLDTCEGDLVSSVDVYVQEPAPKLIATARVHFARLRT